MPRPSSQWNLPQMCSCGRGRGARGGGGAVGISQEPGSAPDHAEGARSHLADAEGAGIRTGSAIKGERERGRRRAEGGGGR